LTHAVDHVHVSHSAPLGVGNDDIIDRMFGNISGVSDTSQPPAAVAAMMASDQASRVLFGRSGLYDVTVRRGTEIIAEFRGRSHRLASG
jgi:hypothetical protein